MLRLLMSTPGSDQYVQEWYDWAGDRIGEFLKGRSGPFNYKVPTVSAGDRNSQWQIDWNNFLTGDKHHQDIQSDVLQGEILPTEEFDREASFFNFDVFRGTGEVGAFTRWNASAVPAHGAFPHDLLTSASFVNSKVLSNNRFRNVVVRQRRRKRQGGNSKTQKRKA